MKINPDQDIQRLYDNIKGKGQEQVEATLLLALKVGHLEGALNAMRKVVGGVSKTLDIALDLDSKAIRITDKSKSR